MKLLVALVQPTVLLLLPALAAALPTEQRSSSSASTCGNYVAGLTAWSNANFAGYSYQYNVSWNTCSTSRILIS